ncbi:uncharacterized protein LOC110366570 [Fundulus heteroclitus]|uniref:uncharacterized protein LOC110366570 n=1 Tax=Fundulus heteroclitus TaxID=8078 RepID=UPI00165A7C4F|nr:uncharacterized protein LOC110366570 [Fundulus heteroclitus]
MHRHAEPHAIAPLLHRPLTYHPMGHQNRNFGLHPDRQRQRPYFGPASAFHSATPKSSRSATRRSSSALHVCIAWRIYYHKQLKKMRQKSNSLPQETSLQLPITSPPDSEQPKEPLPSCRRPHLDSSFKNSGGTSETKEKEAVISHDLPEMLPYKPAFHLSSETQQDDDGEKTGRPVDLLLDENLDPERHKSHQTNTTLSPPLRDKPWDPKVIVEPGGQQRSSLDKKRLLEGCSLDDVKRRRQNDEEEPFDSSSVTAPRVNPSAQRIQVQNMSVSGLCVSCCNGCSPIVSHPGTAPHPYQSASWEQTWNHRMDARLRHKIFKEHFCDGFQRFLAPQRYSPLAPRHQDTVYLRDVFIPAVDENALLLASFSGFPHTRELILP